MVNFSLFDSLMDAFFFFNDKREIVYVNEAAAKLTGFSQKRMKPGKNVFDFLSFKDESLFFMPNGTVGQEEELSYKEVLFSTKDGREGTALVSIKPLGLQKLEDGEASLWQCTCRDISLEVDLHRKNHEKMVELEEYSKNLEQMVEERTAEVQKAHGFINTMVNSLDQGLMVFDRSGDCLPIYTKACERIFETTLDEKKIWEIFGLEEKQVNEMGKWISCLFDEILEFKDMLPLGINNIERGSDWNSEDYRYIQIDYFPMREEEGAPLSGVVVVATDKTDEVRIKRAMVEQEAYVKMVLIVLKHKEQFKSFVKDARQMLIDMKAASKLGRSDVFDQPLMMRLLHSIKGCSSLYSLQALVSCAHQFESDLSVYKEATVDQKLAYQETLRARLSSLEEVFLAAVIEAKKIVGDFEQSSHNFKEIPLKLLLDYSMKLKKLQLARLAGEFDRNFLSEPIGTFFKMYSDQCVQIAEKLSKQLFPISFSGESLPVAPSHYEELFTAMVHPFRNAVDHGIEEPELRKERGKEAAGKIEVLFKKIEKNKKTFLEITISDDGGGVDPAKIRQKLIKEGRIDEQAKESDEEVIYHIFDAAFSTKDSVTEISGRGVGLDALKEAVNKLQGSIILTSEITKGSMLRVLVPYYDS